MEFKIYINSIDKSSDILYNTFRISDYINQQVDTCSFTCKSFKPLLNQEIQVKYGDDIIYGGVIVKVETEVKKGENIYKVTCKDYSQYLNRRLVSERYINKTVGEIIHDLLGEYATDFTVDSAGLDDITNRYRFDENDSTDSVGSQDGIDTDIIYTNGFANFDGISSKIEMSDSTANTGNSNFSVSCRFKSTTEGAWFRTIVAKYGYTSVTPFWGLGWQEANVIGMVIRDTDGVINRASASAGVGLDGEWHTLTGVVDDNYVYFYIDGELQQKTPRTAVTITNDRPITFGNHVTTYATMSLDDVRLYNTALDIDQVAIINNQDLDNNITQITFNRLNLSQCIQALAELLNYSWYVDYAKDIHFFAENDEPAPFNLTETAGNHAWESLKLIDDFSQIRNQIYIIGGDSEAEPRTEEYVADGEQRQFPLAYKYSTITRVRIIGDADLTIGIDGQDEDTAFNVFWSGNKPSQYIRFKDSNYPDASDVVEVTGVPLFPVLVKVPDVSSIAQYGLYEFKIKDPQITSRADAIARGTVELQAYADSIEEGSFTTDKYGLRSGQTIRITIGDTDEDFIIQSVSMNMIDPFNGKWSVKLATVRTLGIIRFLQKFLKIEDDVTEGEVLLELMEFNDQTVVSGAIQSITTREPPYLYADATDTDDEGKWNLATWSDDY